MLLGQGVCTLKNKAQPALTQDMRHGALFLFNPPPTTCLSRGGGGGCCPNTPSPQEQKTYWAMNHSAHGNAILLVVNKANSSMQVNSGFPHLTNTQQIQQSKTFTISCQITVISMVNQN